MKKINVIILILIFVLSCVVTFVILKSKSKQTNLEPNYTINTENDSDLDIKHVDEVQEPIIDEQVIEEESVVNDIRVTDEYVEKTGIYENHEEYISSFGISKEMFDSIVWEHEKGTNEYTYLLYTSDSSFLIKYNSDTDVINITKGL